MKMIIKALEFLRYYFSYKKIRFDNDESVYYISKSEYLDELTIFVKPIKKV